MAPRRKGPFSSDSQRFPEPIVIAPRAFEVGSEVCVRRPRDGRKKAKATLLSFDARVASLKLASGKKRDISVKWVYMLPALEKATSCSVLPGDALAKIASFLSARRTCRAARACRTWKLCFGSAEPAAQWRARLFSRWRPPVTRATLVAEDTDWLNCFKERLDAEGALRARARRDTRYRSFARRLCSWPLCLCVLETRRRALEHHITHPGCWTNLTDDDAKWLANQADRHRKNYDHRRTDLNAANHAQQPKLKQLLADAKARYRHSRVLADFATRRLQR